MPYTTIRLVMGKTLIGGSSDASEFPRDFYKQISGRLERFLLYSGVSAGETKIIQRAKTIYMIAVTSVECHECDLTSVSMMTTVIA